MRTSELLPSEDVIPWEQRGVTQHTFISLKDATAYVRDTEEHCISYAFKFSFKMDHLGNDVWKVTTWIKDD